MTDGQYPPFLREVLTERFPSVNIRVIDEGRATTDTGYIAARIDKWIDRYAPEVILVMGGVNDGLESLPYADIRRPGGGDIRVLRLLRLLIYNIREFFRTNRSAEAAGISGTVYSEDDLEFIEEELKRARIIEYSDGNPDRANEIMRALAEDFPRSYRVFLEIALVNSGFDLPLSIKSAEKAISLAPDIPEPYLARLGFYLDRIERTRKEKGAAPAEEIRKEAAAFLNDNLEVIRKSGEAGMLLIEFGEYSLAEKIIRDHLSRKPGDESLLRQMHTLLLQQGRTGEAALYSIQDYPVKPLTARNFKKIAEISLSAGVTPAFLSYPNRVIGPLKKIFDEFEGQEDILFISNFYNFREALEKGGEFNDLFIDAFGGDFGHCTPEGNRMIAENIAEGLSEMIEEFEESSD